MIDHSSDSKMIAIVTYENYPDGSPGAIRNHSFATALSQMGHNVEVIHKGEETHRSSIRQKSLYRNNKYSKWLLFWWRVISELRKLHKSEGLDAVIIYSCGLLLGMWLIKHWCKRHNVKVIFDVVEWYSPEQCKNGKFSWNYIENDFTNRVIIDRRCRVIAISSYLENYFANKGCHTVRIPIIATERVLEIIPKYDNAIKRTFIYAGSHLKMDNIPMILRSLLLLSDDERKKIKFHIFGMNKKQINAELCIEITEELGNSLIIHGRRPNCNVLECLRSADFCVMFRDPKLRVNRAGFPSKVIESMSMGVPMFCNFSSDLGDFLINGDNAVIASLSTESIANGFRTILAMTPDTVYAMKNKAKKTIENGFSYKKFYTKFTDIIQ